MTDEVREVIRLHAQLPVDTDALQPQANLYAAGMSSHAAVNVMLALEERFDVEFPDHMLTRQVFESIGSLSAALAELGARVHA